MGPVISEERLGPIENMLETPREAALKITPDATAHLKKDPSLKLSMQFIYPLQGWTPLGGNSPSDDLQTNGGFRYVIDGYGPVMDRAIKPVLSNTCPEYSIDFSEHYCPVTRFPQSIPHHDWRPIKIMEGMPGTEYQWLGPSLKEKLFDEWNVKHDPAAKNFLGAFVFRQAGQEEIEWRCQDMRYGFLKEKNLHIRLHQMKDYKEPEYIAYDDEADKAQGTSRRHGHRHEQTAAQKQFLALSKVFGGLQKRSTFGYNSPTETLRDKLGQSMPGFPYEKFSRMSYVYPAGPAYHGKCHSIPKEGDPVDPTLLEQHKRHHRRGLLAVLGATEGAEEGEESLLEGQSSRRFRMEMERRKKHHKLILDTVVDAPQVSADPHECFQKNGAFVFKMGTGETVAAAVEFATDEKANLPLQYNAKSCPPCFANENIPVSETDWQPTTHLTFGGEGIDFVFLPSSTAEEAELFAACSVHDKRVRNFGGAFIFRKQSVTWEDMRYNWRCLDNSFWTKSGHTSGGTNLDFVEDGEIMKERKTSMVSMDNMVDSIDDVDKAVTAPDPFDQPLFNSPDSDSAPAADDGEFSW